MPAFSRNKLAILLIVVFTVTCGAASVIPFASAQEEGPPTRPVTFDPQVTIPGFTGGVVTGTTFGEYVRAFYIFFIGVIGILATVMVMYGGYRWITAAGNASRIQTAKTMVTNAIVGVVLALTSYILLQLINPTLVRITDLSMLTIRPISQPIGSEGDNPFTCPQNFALIAKYGNVDVVAQTKLVTVRYRNTTPPLNIDKPYRVHEMESARFEAVFDAIKNIPYDISRHPDGGAWNMRRNVNNPDCWSLHAFGIAIDINPDKNPNCQLGTRCFDVPQTDIPPEIIDAFLDNGFRWGGNFRSVKDYMHFEVVQ